MACNTGTCRRTELQLGIMHIQPCVKKYLTSFKSQFTTSKMMMMIMMRSYVLHSLVQGLGRCLLKLIRTTFLVHRSNFGQMPFLTPPTTLLGVGRTRTCVSHVKSPRLYQSSHGRSLIHNFKNKIIKYKVYLILRRRFRIVNKS